MTVKLQEIILKGRPLSDGIGIGSPYFLDGFKRSFLQINLEESEVEAEVERYRQAVENLKKEIKISRSELKDHKDRPGIEVLDSQLEVLQDPFLTEEVECTIRHSKVNAEYVLKQILDRYEEKFISLNNSFFLDRFKDIKDLSCRILTFLDGSARFHISYLPPSSIFCVEELTASDAAYARHENVAAFVSSYGGPTTHAAIIAKSKGIPFITNIPLTQIKEVLIESIIVDGRSGNVILNPTEKTILEFSSQQKAQKQLQSNKMPSFTNTETIDGYPLRLFANIDSIDEIKEVQAFGGDGVGLFRSEYLFHQKNRLPSEEEQYEAYLHVAKMMKGALFVIRTFDFEGDKKAIVQEVQKEWNATDKEALLKTQIRAVVRASVHGNLRLLFPMIATVSELVLRKKWLQEAQEAFGLSHKIPVGCMVEIPSAALMLDALAKECDFFSIGTNDLSQYTLGVSRSHETHHDLLDPSVIRLIRWIVGEANRHKMSVCLCGEVAANPKLTSLLIGLGIQEFSVSPRFLAPIREAIQKTSLIEAINLVDDALIGKTIH